MNKEREARCFVSSCCCCGILSLVCLLAVQWCRTSSNKDAGWLGWNEIKKEEPRLLERADAGIGRNVCKSTDMLLGRLWTKNRMFRPARGGCKAKASANSAITDAGGSVRAILFSNYWSYHGRPLAHRRGAEVVGCECEVDHEANLTKCLFQIHPTWHVASSWFLASHSSPFSPITSNISPATYVK